MSDESITIGCACSRLEHALRITKWDDAGTQWLLEMTVPHATLWERLKRAWLHVLGREPSVADVVLEGADVARLVAFVERNGGAGDSRGERVS